MIIKGLFGNLISIIEVRRKNAKILHIVLEAVSFQFGQLFSIFIFLPNERGLEKFWIENWKGLFYQEWREG